MPNHVKPIFDLAPWVPEADRIGEKYYKAVNLGVEQGITVNVDGSVVTLNDSVAPAVKQAEVRSMEIFLQATMSTATVALAMKANSKAAFEKATSRVTENAMLGHRIRQGLNYLHGGTNIGVVASFSSATVTLTAASFAPGIWYGSDGMQVEVWSAVGGTKRSAITTVSSYDIENRTVTFNSATGLANGDLVFLKGTLDAAGAVQESLGIAAVLDSATPSTASARRLTDVQGCVVFGGCSGQSGRSRCGDGACLQSRLLRAGHMTGATFHTWNSRLRETAREAPSALNVEPARSSFA